MRRYYNITPEKEIGDGIFYILKLKRNNKSYIKIGISRNTLKERYTSPELGDAEIIYIHYCKFSKCARLERLVMENFKCINRIDRFSVFGWTEVFDYNATIIDFIFQHLDVHPR